MRRRLLVEALPAPGRALPLGPDPSHHLLGVLRLAPGAELELFDGRGGRCPARLVAVRGRTVEVEATGPIHVDPAPSASALLLGLPRRAALDRALRMATELGAGDIVVFRAERSPGPARPSARWHRIVAAAAAQCGRSHLPRLAAVPDLPAALEGRAGGLVLQPGAPARETSPAEAIVVGPEGGLTGGELAFCRAAGFVPAGLGPLTLRVDTAVSAGLARYGRA